MRFRFLLAGLLAFVPLNAKAYDDPKSLVSAIYAPYLSGQKHPNIEAFYSVRLKQLFADNVLRQGTDETGAPVDLEAPGAVPFDPFIEGTNAHILDVAIDDPVVMGERALTIVSFYNFDEPLLLSIAMLREADGWKVDDIASMGRTENWLLSWLLQFDPFEVK